jgi:tetratricopeptide (TPR) repeat protein
LFCQLAVFVGSWSLEAAEAVCPELDVLELQAQLLQKSLVIADDRADLAARRYRLLETTRQYARDRLLEMGTGELARDRHLEYYRKFSELSSRNIFGPDRRYWMEQCELEHDNFRAALQWGLDRDPEAALALAGALATFWSILATNVEGRHWLHAALERVSALPETTGEASRKRQAVIGNGLLGISQISYGLGDYQVGLETSQQAVGLFRQLEDRNSLGFALCYLGNMAAYQNDFEMAEQSLMEAISIGKALVNNLILGYSTGVLSDIVLRPRGDLSGALFYAEESLRYSHEIPFPWAEAQAELGLARIATIQSQWDKARQHSLKALAIFQDLHEQLVLNMVYSQLADIELCAGNLPEAQRIQQQVLLAWQQLDQRAFLAHTLESYAYIARQQDNPQRAACLLAAAEAVREGVGTSEMGIQRIEVEYKKTIAWLHSELDETAYDQSWSEGCSMTLDQAVAYALETAAGKI